MNGDISIPRLSERVRRVIGMAVRGPDVGCRKVSRRDGQEKKGNWRIGELSRVVCGGGRVTAVGDSGGDAFYRLGGGSRAMSCGRRERGPTRGKAN